MKKNFILMLISFVLIIVVLIVIFSLWKKTKTHDTNQPAEVSNSEEYIYENDKETETGDIVIETTVGISEEMLSFDYSDIDEYSGAAVQVINDNIPFFSQEEKQEMNYLQ